MAQYAAFDYEIPGRGHPSFWHVYSTDADDDDLLDTGTLFYLVGPNTRAMHDAIAATCKAIDDAVTIAKKGERDERYKCKCGQARA